MDKWRSSEFIDEDVDPLGPMANLVDIVLVFACGLIAALVALSPDLQQRFEQTQSKPVSLGKELTEAPQKQGLKPGEGYQSLGQVYRDPKTGKLILIGE